MALGLLVSHGSNGFDAAAWRALHHLLYRGPYRHVVGAVAAERGRWHGAYATAALPLLLALLLALHDHRRGLPGLPVRDWLPWLGTLLLAVPLNLILRIGLGRAGPKDALVPSVGWLGSYPSGAALLVALGWIVGGALAAWSRPRWRGALAAAAAAALLLHAAVRAAMGAHWLTDVLGSYLLAAGAALAAGPPPAR